MTASGRKTGKSDSTDPMGDPELPPDADYADHIEDLFPQVAETYRRLRTDTRLDPVLETFKRQGMDERKIEMLFRQVANLPRDWQNEHESLKQRRERRSSLAKKARQLAEEMAEDPDFSGLGFSDGAIIYGSPETVGNETTLPDILNCAADFVTETDGPLIETENGTITGKKFEEVTAPDRKVSLQRYVLLGIFDLLEPYFLKTDTSRPPNKETELLGSVVLDEGIPHGTVTQLRKNERRSYYKEPE